MLLFFFYITPLIVCTLNEHHDVLDCIIVEDNANILFT